MESLVGLLKGELHVSYVDQLRAQTTRAYKRSCETTEIFGKDHFDDGHQKMIFIKKKRKRPSVLLAKDRFDSC